MEEVLSFLDGVKDDRQQKTSLVIVLFASLADCDQWTEIAEWAKYHQGLLKRAIESAHGVNLRF
ncbi:hypothetical protein FACS1894137_19570 [Spirochaetia bacterium]|nr:hypothetical protein FACS1894137_19570 [Spirochaetia bacterium]